MQLQVEVFDHVTQLVVIRVFPELWGGGVRTVVAQGQPDSAGTGTGTARHCPSVLGQGQPDSATRAGTFPVPTLSSVSPKRPGQAGGTTLQIHSAPDTAEILQILSSLPRHDPFPEG